MASQKKDVEPGGPLLSDASNGPPDFSLEAGQVAAKLYQKMKTEGLDLRRINALVQIEVTQNKLEPSKAADIIKLIIDKRNSDRTKRWEQIEKKAVEKTRKEGGSYTQGIVEPICNIYPIFDELYYYTATTTYPPSHILSDRVGYTFRTVQPPRLLELKAEDLPAFSNILKRIVSNSRAFRAVVLTASHLGFAYTNLVLKLFPDQYTGNISNEIKRLAAWRFLRPTSYSDLKGEPRKNLALVHRFLGQAANVSVREMGNRPKVFEIAPKWLVVVRRFVVPSEAEEAAVKSWETRLRTPHAKRDDDEASIIKHNRAILYGEGEARNDKEVKENENKN